MARSIAPYKIASSESPVKPPTSKTNIILLLTLVIFLFQASKDTFDKLSIVNPAEDQESKLCIVEFKQQGCDPLKLTDNCEKLMPCIQKNKHSVIDNVNEAVRVFSSQICQDLSIAGVLLGLIILVDIRSKKTGIPDQ